MATTTPAEANRSARLRAGACAWRRWSRPVAAALVAGVKEDDILLVAEGARTEGYERGPARHPTNGLIFIDGAQPGDSLEIDIQAIESLEILGVDAFSLTGGARRMTTRTLPSSCFAPQAPIASNLRAA